jgi:hypothetical protein
MGLMMKRKPSRKKPVGALTLLEGRTAKGPWYVVYKVGGSLVKRKTCPASWFFNHDKGGFRQLGWVFTNYFHAYAYSLKCKAKARDPVDTD